MKSFFVKFTRYTTGLLVIRRTYDGHYGNNELGMWGQPIQSTPTTRRHTATAPLFAPRYFQIDQPTVPVQRKCYTGNAQAAYDFFLEDSRRVIQSTLSLMSSTSTLFHSPLRTGWSAFSISISLSIVAVKMPDSLYPEQQQCKNGRAMIRERSTQLCHFLRQVYDHPPTAPHSHPYQITTHTWSTTDSLRLGRHRLLYELQILLAQFMLDGFQIANRVDTVVDVRNFIVLEGTNNVEDSIHGLWVGRHVAFLYLQL